MTTALRKFVAMEPSLERNKTPEPTFLFTSLQNLLDYAPVAMMTVDAKGLILNVNEALERLLGYSRHELVTKAVEILVPNELRSKHVSLRDVFLESPIQRPMGKGRHLSAKHKDGHLVPVEIALNPLNTETGLNVVVVSLLDQSAANRADRAELFVTELKHRAKNMLAVVSAIAKQVGASNPDRSKFEAAFDQRLGSFASSYELLALKDWQAPTIAELVRAQINFVKQDKTSIIEMKGPELRVSVARAEYLGLAIHELATNALKHGALSIPQGTIEMHWCVEENSKQFVFEWREKGGPAVEQLGRKGFGRIVLEHVVPAAFDGKSELRATPSGICWHLEAPISEVLEAQ
jgi:PAS domain S-box-containing protein